MKPYLIFTRAGDAKRNPDSLKLDEESEKSRLHGRAVETDDRPLLHHMFRKGRVIVPEVESEHAGLIIR